jgi:hypothetical protein
MAQGSPGRKVPVVAVAGEAFALVFGRIGLLGELGWLPLLVLLLAAIAPRLLSPGREEEFGLTWPDAVEAAAAAACLTAFAVRWHQSVLFPYRDAVPAGLFRRAWSRFLLYTIILYVASVALLALDLTLAALVPESLGTAAGLAAKLSELAVWLATARLALLFPAAAYGAPLGFAAAWRAMRGNTWRLVFCCLLTWAPIVLVIVLLAEAVLSAAAPDAASARVGLVLLRGVFDTIANFLLVALGAAVLSDFYRRLVRN